ncbi:palmitoyl-protein thioesterase 1-like [Artemia franciscana]|uniref:Palmitoyl-protein thioesterase 1 n=1 Tax=Artemia franciscana TaxID=6661 RepID=A0AA88HNN9_ARTSF|nr:hypothetical protein QYM36_014588 [Artemia franciscana]
MAKELKFKSMLPKNICFVLILLLHALSPILGMFRMNFPTSPVPIVMWHGIGDTCCNPLSLGRIKEVIEKEINGVYVHSISIGHGFAKDAESGYFMPPNKQIEIACEQLRSDDNLKNGYHGLGFSQGGQFLRGLAQRCSDPPMKTLVTLGGQHQGVYGLPKCPGDSKKYCDYIRRLLNHAYSNWVQRILAPAGYWHDPLDEPTYKKKSKFLADINNEVFINQEYKQNLVNLEKLVLVKFNNDTTVQPKESSWFGYYKPGSLVIQRLNETSLWIEDRLGLKKMGDRLVLLDTDGDHLQFSEEWFVTNIVRPYFK